MRFGFTPLYLDAEDVNKAASIIAEVMAKRLWGNAEYFVQSPVT